VAALALVAACAAWVSGCAPAPAPTVPAKTSPATAADKDPGIRFVDVAESSGVNWVARNGEEAGHFAMLESFGTGCAIDDYDRDGQLDLMFAGGGSFGSRQEILPVPMGLFRQLAPWKFAPAARAAGLESIRHYHHGVWTADIDEDGFSDLLLTGWGGLQLFRNQGDGTFIDDTANSGLNDELWSLAAGWADLNRDQVLDLFVGHYVDWSFKNHPTCIDVRLNQRNVCSPDQFQGLPCSVYLGNGDGTFREAGVELGVHGVGKTLGAVIADLNGDLQPDIYVANDTLPNQLYLSQPSGVYREAGIATGVAFGETGASDGSMGVELADLDRDGNPDLWVANYENQTFALYRNLGNDNFVHSSRVFGVTAVGAEAVGFGTVALDADGDGYQDVFCANGHVHAPTLPTERRQKPYFFWNDHGKRLRNVADRAGEYFRQRHLGRGAARGDLDLDGAPDLVVAHTNAPAAVLRNATPVANWLAVELIGRTSPRSAIGARVTIVAGGVQQIGLIAGGGSYLSTSDRTILFGLGAAASVESVEVLWPAGSVTKVGSVRGGQRLRVIEGPPFE
jgi:hypothetical protein